MKSAFLLAAFLVPLVARANDSSFEGVGGSLRPTTGENKAIRMKSELVVLTANPDDYSTRAEFVFHNETGQRQSVVMGFPESNYSENPIKGSGFKRFATWVDGHKVPATRITLKQASPDNFNTYWTKNVSFAPHQTRRVRVEITSPYGNSAMWGFTRNLKYAFTGSNWRGNVGQSTLELRVSQPGLWRVITFGDNSNRQPFSISSDKNGATLRRVWRNWDAEEFVDIGLERVIPFWKVDTEADGSDETRAAVRAAQIVRVKGKPQGFEREGGFASPAFTKDGVVYVSLSHLSDRMEVWGDELSPKIEPQARFDARTGFDLRAGKTTLHVRQGDSSAQINGKTVALGAPVLLVPQGTGNSLFAPLAPIAKALGLRTTFEGERLFSLQHGSWRG
jgi:hypothetical protein